MKSIAISDITLREEGRAGGYTLSFKEKIEIAKLLDKLCVDVIETAPITKGKTDILLLHSIAPLIKNSVLSCPAGFSKESVEEAYEAIKAAAKPRLHIMIPTSTVQMEYMLHKKPTAVLSTLTETLACAKALTPEVEVSMMDATRAERAFLKDAINTAIENGATAITICDSAGGMLPNEFEGFIKELMTDCPSLSGVKLSVECSNSLNMAAACAVSCINAGVEQIKTAVMTDSYPALGAVARIFREKGEALGVSVGINMTALDNSINKIMLMTRTAGINSPFDAGTNTASGESIVLTDKDDIKALSEAVQKLGYELSDEDIGKVYDEFVKISRNKKVGAREIDAIVASVAMQVAPTYKLKSYVINNGNIISSSAHIVLEKNGAELSGICIGDGPVDAAFLAIEQITGHHFELDDFQIHAVTEGREAMGSSVVKLRYNGKPYSGKGISTDVIGASINAYINALNKICFEEV